MPPPELEPVAALPSWYWGFVFFSFGSIFGSLANVCIHRMPLGQSIVTPRSHCPACGYMIPWYHNIPLITWLQLKGRCASCGVAISPRYFLVELLTGVAFLSCWIAFGERSPALAVVVCVILYGFIIATFIDLEHFIIPDEITIGGVAVGFLASASVPLIHDTTDRALAMRESALGIAVGGGLIYAILRLGKMLFGQRQLKLEPGSRLTFGETSLKLPQETMPYSDVFYRKSDTIILHAQQLELVDRCYQDVDVRLSPAKLCIGDEQFSPENVHHMEAVTDHVSLPREAMGFGDVKFMAAIGAFLGWQAVIFTLTVSALLGSAVGITAIVLRRRNWSSLIPFGPYIALAATIWIFFGADVTNWWFRISGSVLNPAAGPLPPG